jgi:small-conductance mechanosensitive channel
VPWHTCGMWQEIELRMGDLGGRVLVALGIFLSGYVLSLVLARAASSALKRTPRGQTLAPLARSVVRVAVSLAAIISALDHVGVPIATVLAGAGILGLAIGFGAQALVKDVISGFFHIVEGILSVGDVVQFGEVTGVVEEIGLRVTQLRTFNGQLWYIPNGSIDRVGNFNRGWCRAVIQVSVAYEGDVRRALAVLKEVGDAYRTEKPDEVLEEPVADGILGLNASDILVRLVLRVKPQTHWGIEREVRIRVKEAFDKAGIEIPFPRQVVYHRQEDGRQLEILSGGAARQA